MMRNCDQSVKINHNTYWPYILDHSCRILIIGCSGSGKNNALLNLIKHQGLNIERNYSYDKDPCESKYQLLINGK